MLHDTTCALNIEQVEERLEWKLLQYDSATIWYFPNMFPHIKLQYDNSVKKILIYVTSSALAVISSKGTSDEGLHGLQGLLIKRYCIGK